MSLELIGVIAAAISLGGVMLATTHGIRREVREEFKAVRKEIKASSQESREEFKAVREEIKASSQESREEFKAVREEIKASSQELRKEIKASSQESREERNADVAQLRSEMQAGFAALRAEMQAGFKELHLRISSLGDRVSKVEGVIEGLFWGARNQQPEKEKSREGAA